MLPATQDTHVRSGISERKHACLHFSMTEHSSKCCGNKNAKQIRQLAPRHSGTKHLSREGRPAPSLGSHSGSGPGLSGSGAPCRTARPRRHRQSRRRYGCPTISAPPASCSCAATWRRLRCDPARAKVNASYTCMLYSQYASLHDVCMTSACRLETCYSVVVYTAGAAERTVR